METLTDPTEPPDEVRPSAVSRFHLLPQTSQVPSFDAHQYSFFTSNTSALEELEVRNAALVLEWLFE